MPRARASRAATAITFSTRAGSQVAASAMGTGKHVPRGAVRPCTASWWVRAGMPRRVFSTSHFWTAFTKRAFSRGPSTMLTGASRSSLGRAIWPMPWARTRAAPAGSKRPASSVMRALPFQRARVWAAFSSTLMRERRSRTRSSTGRAGSR